jgi:hypothetical protein
LRDRAGIEADQSEDSNTQEGGPSTSRRVHSN